MLGISLNTTYTLLRGLGAVRSKRDFARRWLGCGKTYLKDFEKDGREVARVSGVAVASLRFRLGAVAERVPATVAAEIKAVLDELDRACEIADLISRGR